MSKLGAKGTADLLIVANRLPVDQVTLPDDSSVWRTSPGGLVTALEPVLRANDGAWIGWPGDVGNSSPLLPFTTDDGLRLVPVPLHADEFEEFYEGFCNATLWPLYHDVAAQPLFHRKWWYSYLRVNHRFAAKAAECAAPGATVWVQDYQLQLVPQLLRELRPDLRIGFFMHIPFPPTELFGRLPWRRQLLEGLLGADLVGFQLPDGVANFLQLARHRLGLKTTRDAVVLPDGRRVRAGAYPISIDSAGLEGLAKTEAVQARAAEIRERLGQPRRIFLGVDRLDYTKGIYARMRAFGELLAEHQLDVENVAFVQVATPTRERIEQYRVSRDELDRLVGRINGDLGRIGRPAISYLHNNYPREELAALYQAADVMVVTPYRDGMNLVAKEYVACRINGDGALVLSEFAGAAAELKHAWLVNPFDIDGMKQVMLAAARAPEKDRRKRMRAMRKLVLENDVKKWADDFLTALRG